MKKGVTTADEAFQAVVQRLQLSGDQKETKKPKIKRKPVEEIENADVEKLLMESHVEGLVDSASIERLQEGISHRPVAILERRTSNSKHTDQTIGGNPSGSHSAATAAASQLAIEPDELETEQEACSSESQVLVEITKLHIQQAPGMYLLPTLCCRRCCNL